MKKIIGLILVGCFQFAHSNDELITRLEERFPSAQVESVTETNFLGLYEVVINGSVYYVDEEFTHLFDGSLIELSSMRNLTSERNAQIEAAALKAVEIPFDQLPLDDAIKRVFGNGERQFAYFADPNCGYCRKFDKEALGAVSDATLYIFLYPVITEKSIPISKSIWCSDDRARAWDDYVLSGVMPTAPSTCSNPIEDNLAFGKKMLVRATPTLFFENGERVSGALTLEQLEEQLNIAR